ncbi:MAG: hypothetical protein JWP22_2139 [Ramlibacter sp.]|nr:hypothetical protein [Ramlibacter sp.]
MCHLIRQQQAAPERDGIAPAPRTDGLRARWTGAAAAALVAGLAVAALVDPPKASLVSKATAAAPTELTSKAPTTRAATVVEPGAVGADDDVPTSSDVVKAGTDHCSHGM